MRVQFGLFAVAFLAAFVTGCPYEADTSLGEPKEALDTRLLGVWTTTDAESEESSQIRVERNGDSEYAIEIPDDEGETTKMRAFIVTVEGEPFLNISEVKSDGSKQPFVFGRYTISEDGELTLRLVDEKGVPKALKGDRPGLVNYLKEHLHDPALDDQDGPLRLLQDR